MSRAGEGDGAGLRPGPDATEPAPVSPAPVSPAPVSPAPVSPAPVSPGPVDQARDNAATQQIPTVNRIPAVRRSHDEPTVRAVARRAAAALPALGRDGGVEQVPSSARATVDRRRRAAAEAAGLDPDAPGEDMSEDPAEDPGDAESSADGSADASGGAVDPEPVTPEPAVDVLMVDLPKVDVPMVDVPMVEPPAEEPPAILDDLGRPSDTNHPRSTQEEAAEAVRARHLSTHDADEPADDLADDAGAPYTDWQTTNDEWLPVEPGPVARPAVSSPRMVAAPGTGRDAGRHAEAYHGRRRARPTAVWRWVVAACVVLGLAGAVGLPYLLRSSQQPLAAPTGGPTTQKHPLVVMATEEGEMLPAASAPPVTATPRPSTQVAVPPVTATATQDPGTPLPPFSVSLEAEAVPAGLRPNTQLDANPDCYPNGPDVVSRIGNWGQSTPGTITFTVTAPDAGAYTMTVQYVNTSATRTAEIVVNGAAALSPWPSFPNTEAPPTCIDASAPIAVTLQQGSNTIRFGNPGDRAPTIDKIVISRP